MTIRSLLPALLVAVPAFAAAPPGPPIGAPLIDIYKAIHAAPELSRQEEKTSARVAAELRKAGFAVTDHIGLYPDGMRAFGVVGIMRNGPGPTLLIRADMDALPIAEETGLPYASHVRARTSADGRDVGVMHACGHDFHTTILIGVARALAAIKDQWHGTAMLVGQPAEETVEGAKAMLADHVYERFGRPDMIVGLHDSTDLPAGKAGIAIGPAQTGATSIDVTIRGLGGHGAKPQLGRDPVVLAALFVTSLQTIVSREEDPQDPAVVTVGTINGGTKRNIIPDEVKLQLTTRYFSDKAKQTILDGIRNRANGIAVSAGLPADRAPIVTVIEGESSPATYNDPVLAHRVETAMAGALGRDNVRELPPITPSEDVGAFGLDGHKIPLAYYSLGAINPAVYAAAKAGGPPIGELHTSRFVPDPVPTIDAGVKSMTAVAVALLQ